MRTTTLAVSGLLLIAGCHASAPHVAAATTSGLPSVTASSPAPTTRLGVCADVTVHATYPGGQAEFAAGQSPRIILHVGQSFILTAAGRCGVEYQPDDTHLVYTPGQPPPPFFLGGDPNAVASSPPVQAGAATATLAPHPVSFTATSTGMTTLPVVVDDQVAAFDTAINIIVTIEDKQ
jgi:hypothetical protein